MGQLHQKVGAVHGSYGRNIQTMYGSNPSTASTTGIGIVDKIQVALEQSNNTYIETFKSIHQIETDIEQTTGQSIETI